MIPIGFTYDFLKILTTLSIHILIVQTSEFFRCVSPHNYHPDQVIKHIQVLRKINFAPFLDGFPSSRSNHYSDFYRRGHVLAYLKKKKLFCIYLFVFGCAGSSWLCARSSLAAASGGDSLGAVLRLLLAERGLQGKRASWLQHVGSGVAPSGLWILAL